MGLKLAVIPWNNSGLKDRIFAVEDSNDCRNEPFFKMQKEFEKNGDLFHTVDYYKDLKEVDFFLFFELDWVWLNEIIKVGASNRMIYCNAEPPVVNEINTPKGYQFLSRFFPYILTWNSEWVDGKLIFKRNIPFHFREDFGDIKFENRKLLTSISGNKKSTHPDELYSEREKVITYFEKNYFEQFDFYGTRWDVQKHPSYKGLADRKTDVYHRYRFAICFENMTNIKDYVTEKIFDCLVAGIVPIYYGADNIEEYVGKDCFVDYRKYHNLEELAKYLLSVDEEEYQRYLIAGKKVLHSNILEKFSGEEYARNVYDVIKVKKEFKVSLLNRVYIKFCIWKQKYIWGLKSKIKRVVKRHK